MTDTTTRRPLFAGHRFPDSPLLREHLQQLRADALRQAEERATDQAQQITDTATLMLRVNEAGRDVEAIRRHRRLMWPIHAVALLMSAAGLAVGVVLTLLLQDATTATAPRSEAPALAATAGGISITPTGGRKIIYDRIPLPAPPALEEVDDKGEAAK